MSESTDVAPVTKLLSTHPECEELALPLWTISRGATPPIWVDVSMQINQAALQKSYKARKGPQSSHSDRSNSWMGVRLMSWLGSSKDDTPSHAGADTAMPVVMTRDSCLSTLHRALGSPAMRYSTHKAAKAKTLLFW